MWDVFEQPWTLIGMSILVLLGVWTFRSVFPEKNHWWQYLIPISVVAIAFGLDYLVKTDNEKIHSLIVGVNKAIKNEDCDSIEAMIADDYSDSIHSSKQAILERCRNELTGPTIINITKLGTTTEITGQKAKIFLRISVKFEENSKVAKLYKQQAFLGLDIYLKKHFDGKWLINRVELIELDYAPFNWGQA